MKTKIRLREFALMLLVCATALAVLFHSDRGQSQIISATTPVPDVGSEGGPSIVLNAVDEARWRRGRAIFDKDFTLAEGLGSPDFNGDSCRACHQFPVIGGGGGLDLNVSRYGRIDPVSGNYNDEPGGQVASRLRTPDVPLRDEVMGIANVFEQRQAQPLFGAGLIDSISDQEIMMNADPSDGDGDGIFGIPRIIPIGSTGDGPPNTEVGRFGWKAQMPRLGDFIRDGMGAECGITVPDNGRGFGITTDSDNVADPEISTTDLEDLEFFMGHLAAPPRVASGSSAVAQGEALFSSIGCAKCHTPSLMGADGPVPLYSNLLLHNVMATNFRGVAEPGADVGFYRTPPLWGVSRTAPYLHDGRAETLLEAILAHEGEASGVTAAFEALIEADKNALISFLEDL